MTCRLTVFLLAGGIIAVPTAGKAEIAEDGDLVVTAENIPGRVGSPRIVADNAFLTERQPRNVAEALRFLPGVSAKTNSRGETIARVRGSEERQTQVFLDGAPLAVPWDGRVDLGVLPAGLVGSVEVAKGAVPIEYGTNAVAGAVDLLTVRDNEGVEALAQGGPRGFGNASLVGGLDAGDIGILLAASGLTRDSEPVARYRAVPFSQARGRGRTNTDIDSLSLFGAVRYSGATTGARASLLRVATRRGIAPESDRLPATASPRYWRYPDIDTTQLTLNGTADLADAVRLRAVGWRQWFRQSIDQYGDDTSSIARTRQDDRDDTLGGRLTLATAHAPFNLRLTGSAQTSRHRQVDTNLVTAVPGPSLIYRQNLYTLGAEADAPVGPVRVTLGIGYDWAATPRSGDKPPQPDMSAPAFSLAVRSDPGDGTTLTLSAGRRTRFPSARELFGEALGRFLINPDLKPETAWLADIELAWASEGASLSFNPFYSRGEDTLGQRVVRVGGVSLRQRYNLSGTRTYGVDVQANVTLAPGFGAELFATALSARALSGDAAFRKLPQRPDYEAGGALSYRPVEGGLLRAEYRRVGPAVDLDATGARSALPPGNEVNLRGEWRVGEVGESPVSITMAVDNLTDELISPQLGLPLPGRTVRVGLRVD
ncbi:MAG: hypothetical protein JWL91_1498 [Sphingomonas bacterium]|nr:TonB-dependent receptor [Sphingomonas bacterium]MDB5689622.1 hypothetical protein [Sphingomonas bacterium]